MTRLSSYFLPMLKEPPADAEALSHVLMVRAGLVRQLGAGMWTFLPAGWRAHRRVEQILREEMDAIGAREMLMPVLQPRELWDQTGRSEIPELFKLEDRNERPLVLAMTHEEAVTFHVSQEVRSYRDLPLILYHLQIKERDEPRPRAGVLRTREFIMKDAYSFDRDAEGLDESYRLNVEAYDRIFDRSGLRWYRVEADVGMMGGSGAHEYMAPCAAGENEVALSDAGYAANVEVATGTPPAPSFPRALDAPERVATPDARTIEEVSAYLGIDPATLLKALPVVAGGRHDEAGARAGRPAAERDQAPERARHAVPAGDRGGDPRHRSAPSRASSDPSAWASRSSPTSRSRWARWVAGANETGFHLRGVEARPRLRADGSPTSARSRRGTPVRRAARSTSSRRSRWRTSSSSAPATPSRWARPTSTRTDRSTRS